uniref:Uncharacterized protein n=1 Tax=Photinus pyralis TaxID=7054 RepID=A0A1Y1LZY3_PHOPY
MLKERVLSNEKNINRPITSELLKTLFMSQHLPTSKTIREGRRHPTRCCLQGCWAPSLFLHAIGGCDSTSAFFQQGKMKFVNAIEINPQLRNGAQNLQNP